MLVVIRFNLFINQGEDRQEGLQRDRGACTYSIPLYNQTVNCLPALFPHPGYLRFPPSCQPPTSARILYAHRVHHWRIRFQPRIPTIRLARIKLHHTAHNGILRQLLRRSSPGLRYARNPQSQHHHNPNGQLANKILLGIKSQSRLPFRAPTPLPADPSHLRARAPDDLTREAARRAGQVSGLCEFDQRRCDWLSEEGYRWPG
jgi:hypothetical protein